MQTRKRRPSLYEYTAGQAGEVSKKHKYYRREPIHNYSHTKLSFCGASNLPPLLRLRTFVPMIAGEIRRYLRDNSSIRVSRSMRDTAYRVLQVKERLTAERQKEPDIAEIAKILEISSQDVYFALDAISEPISIYEPVFSDGGESICVMDQIGDTKNTDDAWIEQISLSAAVSSLDKREKRILALRFYDGKTQMEVATEVGISQAQVSRLEKNAIEQIKKSIDAG